MAEVPGDVEKGSQKSSSNSVGSKYVYLEDLPAGKMEY